jgi:hypothetical protein
MGGDVAAPAMRVGFNYPQFANRDGHQFGPFPQVDPKDTSQQNPLWIKTLPVNLQVLKKMNVSVVRWFILGNCFNYGPPPQKVVIRTPGNVSVQWRFDQPDFLDDPNYRGDPDGKVRKFVDHIPLMLAEFAKPGVDIQVIPCLIDFHALLDPLLAERSPNVAHRARGRGDIVTDPVKRSRFFERVLKPLLNLSLPFKSHIYAWEVINEPIWNVNLLKPVNPVLNNRVIPEGDMISFLEQACTIIEDAGFPSTVGHRFFEDCLKFPTGTIAQYHYYPRTATVPLPGAGPLLGGPSILTTTLTFNDDPSPIPEYADALQKIRNAQRKVRPTMAARGKNVDDVFVGEFGATLDGAHGDFWPELRPKDKTADEIVFQRLGLLSKKGYKLAAVWPDLPAGDDTIDKKLDPTKIQSLVRFSGGKFP